MKRNNTLKNTSSIYLSVSDCTYVYIVWGPSGSQRIGSVRNGAKQRMYMHIYICICTYVCIYGKHIKKVRATIVRSCADVAYIAIAFCAFREYFSFRFVTLRFFSILFNSIGFVLSCVVFGLIYFILFLFLLFVFESNRIEYNTRLRFPLRTPPDRKCRMYDANDAAD